MLHAFMRPENRNLLKQLQSRILVIELRAQDRTLFAAAKLSVGHAGRLALLSERVKTCVSVWAWHRPAPRELTHPR